MQLLRNRVAALLNRSQLGNSRRKSNSVRKVKNSDANTVNLKLIERERMKSMQYDVKICCKKGCKNSAEYRKKRYVKFEITL